MPVYGFFSFDEKREFVHEYLSLPYGAKTPFLKEHDVSRGQVNRWRSQVFADTLEMDLVPRKGGVAGVDDIAAVKRLRAENQALRDQLVAKEEELASQRRAVDALGKAIEILRPSDAGKNSDSVNQRPAHSSNPRQPRR